MGGSNDLTDFPSLQHWFGRGRYLSLGGHRIFTVSEGAADAPVVLLIHGFPTSSWDWQPMWELLVQDYRLVALDMLGFGFSDKPNRRNYSIHGQADLVEALVRELGLDEFHVLAHDYGDTVAQELLARQNRHYGAGRWLTCCFLNGGLFPETHQALLTQKLLLSPLGPLLNRFSGKARFDASFSSVFGAHSKPDEQALAEFWCLVNYNNGKHLFHNLITYMRDRREHRERWLEALRDAAIPLALVNGSVDPVSGAHMVARYRELECRLDYLAELPAIGHYPQVEAPLQVANCYREFLAGDSNKASVAGS